MATPADRKRSLTPTGHGRRGSTREHRERRVDGSDDAAAGLGPGAAGRGESQFDRSAGAAALVLEPDAFLAPGGPQPSRTLGVPGRAGLLLVLALFFQGPLALLKQLFDLPGHVRLVRKATRRVWRAGRMVSIAIGFTVLSWTASQALVFIRDSGRRLDLILLTKSRRPGELALEQGILAGMTPLRDVAGLGDNLPLLIIAAIVVFRASLDLPGWGLSPGEGAGVFGCADRARAGRR